MHDRGSGGGGGHEVQPEELIKVGGRSGKLGSQLVQLSQAGAEESTAAVGAHQGWAVSGALQSVQASRERNIEGFGRWLDDLDDRLSAAGREYQKSEQWSMDKLRGIGV